MSRKAALRLTVYLAGLMLLALGLTLNVKSDLGVSPIISSANVFSATLPCPIGDATFVLYSLFVLAEMAIHLVIWRRRKEGSIARRLVMDMLQLPLSLVFTRVMNLFEAAIPTFTRLGGRLVILAAAIICTGLGAAMSLDMRLIPNPGDGFVQSLADLTGWETGLMKNIVDGVSVTLALTLGLCLSGTVVGVGVGTILAFLFVGRVIALFNRCFWGRLSGLTEGE